MTMPTNDDFDDNNSDAAKARLPDSIRKAVASGLSALFMTEEGIRNMLTEMRLPKDAMAYVVQQTERSRKELFRAVSEELKGFLKGVDLTGEIRKALTGLKVQVNAEIRFVDEGSGKTSVQVQQFETSVKEKKHKGSQHE